MNNDMNDDINNDLNDDINNSSDVKVRNALEALVKNNVLSMYLSNHKLADKITLVNEAIQAHLNKLEPTETSKALEDSCTHFNSNNEQGSHGILGSNDSNTDLEQ